MAWQNPTANANFDTDTAGQANSYWLPEIFSKKVQIAFRNSAVIEAITNTDYMGEIASYGDTVNIIKEPDITITAYQRGDASLTSTDLTDEELQLVVDQANHFEFYIDDLEKKFSHINWQDVASNRAGYKLRDTADAYVLGQMLAGLSTSAPDMLIGTDAVADLTVLPADMGGVGELIIGQGASQIDPLSVMARFARVLDEQNVPSEDRWFVAGPKWYEALASTDSKLMTTDYNAGLGSLRNGLVQEGKVRGFNMFVSNNMPTPTNAAEVVLAGHKSSTAFAEQLTKVETLRSTATFRDIVRGLHVFGMKVLRTESICGGYVNVA